MTTQNLAIGQKVQLNDGRPAVIQFKGATAFAPGEWIGVELEEASGKNDGSVQGQRYFDCSDGHGMFLRSTGISKVLDKGGVKSADSKRQSTSAGAAKSRQSTVGLGTKTRTAATNGKSRESLISSPTPSRGNTSRMSSLRSPLTSPTKQLGATGSSASSTTSTPAAGRRTTTSTLKPRASLAPSASVPSRRTSALTASTPSSSRTAARPSAVTPRSQVRTPGSGDGPVGKGGRTNIAARLSDHSEASTHTSATTGDGESIDQTDHFLQSPASAAQTKTNEDADGVKSNGHIPDGSDDLHDDIDATPKPVRRPSAKDVTPSRTPSTQSLSPTISATSYRPSTARSTAAANREIEDLNTKLRVLEKRRMEDREKLKVLERLQQERDRFESIIGKLQQKYQPQQQELADLKRQLKESEERFEAVEKLQADFDAELENVALDREMAEEQYEVAKVELAALREKYEEAELELEVLREENQELGQEMSPEERTSQGWLQLERSNERYREALIRLRDVTQEQEQDLKHQISSLEKELDQFSGINEEAENVKVKLLESEAAINDLKQQLELAQGGEEMLEELSERNMALQERIEDLSATIEDLEHLKELNDELEINRIEAEKGMQEEIDFKDSIITGQFRRAQEQQKAIDDYEMTVVRFREAFRSLQADLEDMRASKQITDSEAQDLNSKSRALIDLNMKLQSSAAKTQIKSLDLELQRLEAEEASQHFSIVRLFLPETYQSDRDSVLTLLRFKRIAFKAELVHTTIKERVADHIGDDLFAGCAVLDRLSWISAMSQRFIVGINEATAAEFGKFQAALHELEPIERSLNTYLDMLRREDLQLKKLDAETQRSIAVMDHLASTLLPDSPASFADEVSMKASMVQSHLESTAAALSLCKSFVEAHSQAPDAGTDENEDEEAASVPSFEPFFDRIESLISEARSAKVIAGKAHRELSDLRARSMTLESTTSTTFASAESSASNIALFVRTAGERLTNLLDPTIPSDTLTPHRVIPVLTSTAKDIFSLSTPETSPLSTLHSRLTALTTSLTNLHSLTTDLSRTVEFTIPPPPWIQRAQDLKNAALSSSADKAELLRLNEVLKERNLTVRSKETELDEQGVRIEMLEARMKEASKRTALIEELEGKLVAAQEERKKAFREVEAAAREVKRLRGERDEARRALEEGGGRKGVVEKEEGLGRLGRAELERRRVQVEGLRGVVRFLNAEAPREREDLEWLQAPLVRPYGEEVARARLLEKEGRDVLWHIMEMTVNSKPVSLKLEEGTDRLKWRPARDTNAWIVRKRREDYAAWSEWRNAVVQKATALSREKRGS